MIDTIKDAQTRAVLYSLAETSGTNGLRSHWNFRCLRTELPDYIHDFEKENRHHCFRILRKVSEMNLNKKAFKRVPSFKPHNKK